MVIFAAVVAGVSWWAWSRRRSFVEPSEVASGYSSTRDAEHANHGARRSFYCRHPYIPTAVGVELVYDVWDSAEPSIVRRATLTSVRAAPLAMSVEWEMVLVGLPPVRGVARCVLDDGAEEPWLVPPAPIADLRGGRWLWPADIEVGSVFEGDTEMTILGEVVRVTRAHRVVAQEEVRVPAGAFDALRVTWEESTDRAGTSATGTAWIAREVGLVRSVTATSPTTDVHWELRSAEL